MKNPFLPLTTISLVCPAIRTGLLLLFASLSLCIARSTRADPAGTLINPRWFHTATPLLDGRVLLAGGEVQGSATDSCEVYDPAINTWTATGSLNQARWSHSA